MEIIFAVGIGVIIYGIIFYLNASKKNKLKSENKIIDRNAIFFKREHFFETSTSNLREIGEAIDKSSLPRTYLLSLITNTELSYSIIMLLTARLVQD